MLFMLYCGKNSDSLTDPAHLKYIKMALFSRTIISELLTPTEGAPMFHAYQVYFQLQEWNTFLGTCPGSKRLRVKVKKCLFGAIYDGQRTCPRIYKTIRCNRRVTSKNLCSGSSVPAPITSLSRQLLVEVVAKMNAKMM